MMWLERHVDPIWCTSDMSFDFALFTLGPFRRNSPADNPWGAFEPSPLLGGTAPAWWKETKKTQETPKAMSCWEWEAASADRGLSERILSNLLGYEEFRIGCRRFSSSRESSNVPETARHKSLRYRPTEIYLRHSS